MTPRKSPDYFAVSRTLAASYVFIVPLLVASGAGAEARKVMGMTVFSGMLVAPV